MRVLHWLNMFLPDPGGIQSLCAELLPALAERGHEVMLLTSLTAPSQNAQSMLGPVDVRRVDSLRALLDRNPGRILRARLEITRIVDEFDPDLVHLHPCGPDIAYYTEIQRRRPRLTVATLHNNYARTNMDFGPSSLFGRAYVETSRIAAVSDDARRVASLDAARPRGKNPHHPQWDLALRGPGHVAALEPADVAVSRADRASEAPRRPAAVIRRARSRRDPEVRLRIAGDRNRARPVTELARSLGVGHRVELPRPE